MNESIIAPRTSSCNLLRLRGLAGIATVLSLAACGGGSHESPRVQAIQASPAPEPLAPAPPPPPPLECFGPPRAFGGTLTGTESQDIIVVTDGQCNFWSVYGMDAVGNFKAAGMLTAFRGTASSPLRWPATDWGRPAVGVRAQGAQIDLTLDPAVPSISGTLTTATNARMIVGSALPAAGYRFLEAATLDTVRGHWDLITSQGHTLSIDIAEDGSISGSSSGSCVLRNSRIAQNSSSNFYALEMHFASVDGLACDTPHGPHGVWGIAVAYTPGGGGLQLVIAAFNAAWDPIYLAAAGRR